MAWLQASPLGATSLRVPEGEEVGQITIRVLRGRSHTDHIGVVFRDEERHQQEGGDVCDGY